MPFGPVFGNVFYRAAGGLSSNLPRRPGPPGGDIRNAVIQALSPDTFAIFDPSDSNVRYQDSAGTTLANTSTNPIGLHLDVSQGLELGANIAPGGGTFDSSSGFSLGAGWSISGGTAQRTDTGSFSNLTASGIATAGKTYEIVVEVSENSGSALALAAGWSSYTVASAGTYTLRVAASSSNAIIQKTGAGTCEIESWSIRELPGHHAVQGTTAEKPLYDLTGGIHSVEHDLFDDNLVVTLPDLGTDATVKYVTSGGITTLTGQTISGDYTLPQATWQGVVIYEGPMSSAQAEAVDAWLNAKAGL